MTTAYAKDESIVEVDNAEPLGTETISTGPADSHAIGSNQVEPLPMASESVHEDPLSSEVEAFNPVPVGSEPIDETINSELASSELTHSEPAGSEPGEHELASSEVIHSQPASSEQVDPELESSEMIYSQPATEDFVYSQAAVVQESENPESAGSELTDTQPQSNESDNSVLVNAGVTVPEPVSYDHGNEQPENTELVGTEPGSSELVHSQDDNPEAAFTDVAGSDAAHLEPAGSEPVGSNMIDSEPVHSDRPGSENVHLEQASFDQEHSQMVGTEGVHSQTVEPELVDSQAVASEPEGAEHSYAESSEADHSQSELHSEAMNVQYEITELPTSHTDNMEIENVQNETDGGHMELMISAHADSESGHAEYMTTEPMYTETISLEQDHSEHVGSHLEYSQHYDSELDHTQPLEIVYSHSMDPEIVHSEPAGTELAHLQPGTSGLVLSHGFTYESVDLHPTAMELANAQYSNSELVVSEPANPETQPNKRRKKKSIVWEHFTIETVGNGCRRACCKVCKQSFAYSTGSKVAGTSHLKRHIAKGSCPVILRQQERNQLTPYMPKSGGTEASTGAGTDPPKRRYRSSGSPYLIFDQDKCRHEIAKMIIKHEYPLHIVEHSGFVAFVQSLQPRFDMVNVDTVRGDCVATYLKEKQKLQNFINVLPGCICLALDVWTSNHSTSYVFLTGQYIDNDWKSHRRLLNVVMEPFPDSESALSHAVATCLSYWGLENRLSSITVDQPLSDIARENLRSLLSRKNPRTLNGQMLVASCIARTLSNMALEVLDAGEHSVEKVRASVKFLKASDSREEKFLELKQQLQVPTERTLVLDNLTRWDTTYNMLLAASDLKEVFSCLDTSDSEYKDAPSLEEWKQVESLCSQLKLLYETANLLTENTNPPPNVFFHEAWKIQLEMARTAASDDPFVSSLAKPMQDTFKKYWEDSCLVLAIAVAMDPRFKMKLVEFSFTKIFGEQAPGYIRAVDEGIHEIFHEYEALSAQTPTLAYGEHGNGMHVKTEQQDGGNFLTTNGLTDFDMYIMETTSQLSKSELDQYLEESLLPRVQDFDILGWWKLNRIKYPTLSKMARDILTIPMSTVGPDLVFDTVRREMDSYRSSLRPETLEALVCAKDWLRFDTSSDVSGSGTVKMEV